MAQGRREKILPEDQGETGDDRKEVEGGSLGEENSSRVEAEEIRWLAVEGNQREGVEVQMMEGELVAQNQVAVAVAEQETLPVMEAGRKVVAASWARNGMEAWLAEKVEEKNVLMAMIHQTTEEMVAEENV